MRDANRSEAEMAEGKCGIRDAGGHGLRERRVLPRGRFWALAKVVNDFSRRDLA